jgi:hypothetical protein
VTSHDQSFLKLAQVAFYVNHKARDQFLGPDDPLKLRFLDLEKVAFSAAQKAENDSASPEDA